MGKSRALLDKARLKIPKNPHLWLCTIRNELAADNRKIALQLLAQAMQECPKCATSALGALPEVARTGQIARLGLPMWPLRSTVRRRSGVLWAEAIQLEPRPQRKSKSIDALKRCALGTSTAHDLT